MREKGLFITFEGGEGSGKTSVLKELKKLIQHLIKDLNKQGVFSYKGVLATREPGGVDNKLAESIRRIVLSKKYEMPPLTEALLFAASRSAHVIQTIIPALENDMVVLSDRFVASSIVYQQYVRDLGEPVEKINEYAICGVKPDIIFYLRINPKVGLQRIKENNRDTNRLDMEDLSFHEKISEYYDRCLLGKEKWSIKLLGENNVVCIETDNKDIHTVAEECLIEIANRTYKKHSL